MVIWLLTVFVMLLPSPCRAKQFTHEDVQTMKNYTIAVAYTEGVDKNLAFAVVEMESMWNPLVKGDGDSSIGLFQIKCNSAKEVGFTGNCSKLLNYKVNILYGVRYLKLQISKHGIRGGVAAYNAGRPIVRNGKYINQYYVSETMKRYYALKKQGKSKT